MATTMGASRRRAESFRTETQSFRIHEDVPSTEDTEMNESAPQVTDEIEQEAELLEEDGQESEYSESSEDEPPADGHFQQDMERLQDSFAGFRQKYRLIKRIGEGLRPPAQATPSPGLPC
jgi:cell division control protein 7